MRNFDNAMITENTHTQTTCFLGDIATERAAPEKKTEWLNNGFKSLLFDEIGWNFIADRYIITY